MVILEALRHRTVIIGNSGSGKSTLARQLAAITQIPVLELDDVHWEKDGCGIKRDEDAARGDVRRMAAASQWIIEGAFGWLAEIAMPRATALIWLDLPWSVCHDGLIARGPRQGCGAQEFNDLLTWAEQYWTRETSTSQKGHSNIFEQFPGAKVRLHSRDEERDFVASLSAPEPRR